MSGSELEGQKRELFGADTAHCDLCGMLVPSSELQEVESGSPLADHDHVNLICGTCWERIHRGELDVESFLIEEDEPAPEPEW